jgi:hypothetical protein
MFKRIWKTASSVQATFWLLCLAALFFVIGSIYFRFEKQFLPQLNFSLIQDWIMNVGWQQPGLSWWFFILLFLLFLLGVNTVACSIDRLQRLLPLYKKTAKLEFAVTLTPTLVHLVFILVLCGHLLSSFAGSVEKVSCAAGQTVALPGGRSLQVLAVRYATHDRPASLAGKLKGMSADLRFHSPGFDGEFTAAILSPAQRAGYSFHLDSVDKYARTRELSLIIRRDTGIRIIIPGLITIILLMAWYFPALWYLKKQNRGEINS